MNKENGYNSGYTTGYADGLMIGYEKGRADERAKTIDETLKIINRKIALLEERLRIETCEGRWVDEEKCLFAIEQLEFLAEQLKGDAECRE